MARVFISYRSSDGADKATRLARELGLVFGDGPIFLDKDDLPAGQSWREAVAAELGARPILLVLVTPDCFGARNAAGGRRIDQADDPVRREIAGAIEMQATVIPVLADGVERLPEGLPAPLDSLGERTWRRLRAYDWGTDLARLVADLEALGIARATPLPNPGRERRRRVALVGAGIVALTTAGLGWWFGPRAERLANDLSGNWTASVAPPSDETESRLDRVLLDLSQQGEALALVSRAIDITQVPAWRSLRANLLRIDNQKLDLVVWRGKGKLVREQGQPLRIDIELSVESEAGGTRFEGGGLVAQANAAGTEMSGSLWLNGEQVERKLALRRGH